MAIVTGIFLQHLSKISRRFFSYIQNNRLDLYVLAYFGFLIFLLSRINGLELVLPLLSTRFLGFTPFEATLILVMMLAAMSSAKTQANSASLILMGLVSYGTGFLYLANAAPDLALVQFLVATLTLVVLFASFRHLPKAPFRALRKPQKLINFCISVATGIFVGALTFLSSTTLRLETLSRYFSENTLRLVSERNIVNAILFHFRSIDTLIAIFILVAVSASFFDMQKSRNQKQ